MHSVGYAIPSGCKDDRSNEMVRLEASFSMDNDLFLVVQNAP
jgi:hypothetical protein